MSPSPGRLQSQCSPMVCSTATSWRLKSQNPSQAMSSWMQVAAQELGVPLEQVHIAETATDKVPNTSPSAASASSDLYCMAVIDACSQLRDRLAPFRQPKPNAQENGHAQGKPPSFAEAVQAAYQGMVDLSAHGFHAITTITGLHPRD